MIVWVPGLADHPIFSLVADASRTLNCVRDIEDKLWMRDALCKCRDCRLKGQRDPATREI
jgi:hypothetical protein